MDHLLRLTKRILIALLLAGVCSAQSTVTGILKDLTGATITSGKVTFTLQPSRDTTISGVARFAPQTVTCPLASTGNIVSLANANATTTSGTTSPGTSVVVSSATGFAIGQNILIAGAGTPGVNGGNYIGAISNIAGTTFTLSPATITSVAAGAAVYTPCQVAMNTSLSPPGTSWAVGVWPNFVKTSTFSFYSVNAWYDWSTVVPTPTTAPAQNFVDIFSNQTIGGNKTWSGLQTFNNGISLGPIAGVFTNTQMNPNVTLLLNGANLQTEWTYGQGIGFDTEGYSSAIIVPSTATAHQVTPFAGYVDSFCNSSGGNTCNAVALYGAAYAHANGASVYGLNTLMSDFGGITGSRMFNEFDVNVNGSPTLLIAGALITGQFTGTFPSGGVTPGLTGCPATGSFVFFICPASGTQQFQNGIDFARGIVAGTAIHLDATSNTGSASGSQIFESCGWDGANAHCADLTADQTGNFLYALPTGKSLTAPILAVSPGGTVTPLCGGGTPTISPGTGFNSGTLLAGTYSNCSFVVNIGSGTANSTGTISFTNITAVNGWNCHAINQARGAVIGQINSTSTSVTFQNYGSTFAATNWTTGDQLLITCSGR